MRLAPDFDPRTWGYRKLKDLVAEHPAYVVQERTGADGRTTAVYIRIQSRSHWCKIFGCSIPRVDDA